MGHGDDEDRAWCDANPVSDHQANLIFRRAVRIAQRLRIKKAQEFAGKQFAVDLKEGLEDLQAILSKVRVIPKQSYLLLSLKADLVILLEAIDLRDYQQWLATR